MCLCGVLMFSTATYGAIKQQAVDIRDDEIQAYVQAIENLESTLEAQMAEYGVSGASVALMENGEVIYSQGFGTANSDTAQKVTAETMFNIGSVSKIYTAAAALRLQEDGLLSLDTPVIEYLPQFQMDDSRYQQITVRMLLNHTSGLPGDTHGTAALLTEGHIIQVNTAENILRDLSGMKLKHDPGKYTAYSNDGYTLVQLVIEEVSGMPLDEYLMEAFFQPMGISNTYASSDERLTNTQFALDHNDYGNTMPREVSASDITGAGGLVSTSEDICTFVSQILSPTSGILTEASIQELRKNQTLETYFGEASMLNGLGFDYTMPNITKTQVLSKNGGTTVYGAQVLTAPDAGITVAGISTGSPRTSPIYMATITFMQDILAEKEMVSRSNKLQPELKAAQMPESMTDYTGIYSMMQGNPIRFTALDETMLMESWYNSQWIAVDELEYMENGTFGHPTEGAYVGYLPMEIDGKRYFAQYTKNGETEYSIIYLQQLDQDAEIEIWDIADGSLWLNTNAVREDYNLSGICTATYNVLDDVNGYFDFGGTQFKSIDHETAVTACEIISGKGELYRKTNYIQFGGDAYIPSSTAEGIEISGEALNIELAEDNIAQWYQVSKDSTIAVDANFDNVVRWLALDGAGIVIYDSFNQTTNSFDIPEGGFLLFCGQSGSSIQLRVNER